MNSGIHLGYAWLLGNAGSFTLNERRAVAVAGVAADIDGAAIIFGRETFNTYHHVVFHNLIFAGVITLAAFILFPRRPRLVLFCGLAGLLHLGIDFLGSHWDQELFRPFSSLPVNLTSLLPEWLVIYVFQGAGTIVMFGLMFRVFLKEGRTFLEVFTQTGDRLVMKFVTLPWRHRCGNCGRRAFYQCSGCGAYLCPGHRYIGKGWQLLCGNCLDTEQENKDTVLRQETSEDS